MIIDSLKLSHYRGAVDLSLQFDKRINVLVGVNGAGKSTVLDAIVVMLSWTVSRMRHSGTSGRPIDENHITNGKSVASIELVAHDDNSNLSWRLVKGRAGHGTGEEKSNLSELSDYTKDWHSRITAANEKINLPLFAYYPVNRAVLDIPLRIREKHSFTLLTAYDESLTGGANFRTFFEWFREREDLENEYRKYQNDLIKPEGYQFPDPQLEAVRLALMKFMPEFNHLTVRRNPLRMEVEKNGQRLQVNQLSDGEKCLIAMIGDLARRLAIANPLLANPLNGHGVVLIDEVDLHLHPKWQRMVVPKLLEVFEGCQFFLSTHSPHVLTNVQHDKIFLLRQTEIGTQFEHPIESYGKNVDRVLEDLMGLETTRPDVVEESLNRIFTTIEMGELENARAQISQLREEIGDDPALVKANVLIRRREVIGR